jgi:histidinol phosphatase-like enzyme
VDRWGTLLKPLAADLPRAAGGLPPVDEELFQTGAVDALFRARQAEWELYLIGNEIEVAQGRVSESSWKSFEAELLEFLRLRGAPIRRSYACLDHPEGKQEHRRDSVFRLPNTGALYHAAQFDGISLPHSWVVGDEHLELVAGWRAGCHMGGLGTVEELVRGELLVEPDLCASSLAELLADVPALSPAPLR